MKKKINHTVGSALAKIVRNPVQAVLALIAVSGYFTIMGILLFRDIPPGVKDVLLTLFGCLTTIVVQIYQFYFGSSKGSQEKSDVISGMGKQKEPENP